MSGPNVAIWDFTYSKAVEFAGKICALILFSCMVNESLKRWPDISDAKA